MTHRCLSWKLLVSVGSIGFVLACRSSTSGSDRTGSRGSAAKATIGVSECDEYIERVTKCISEHAPEDKREALEANLTRTQATWTALAANPGTRPSLGQACGLALSSIKANLQALSCEW
jgi:hypothetical protein